MYSVPSRKSYDKCHLGKLSLLASTLLLIQINPAMAAPKAMGMLEIHNTANAEYQVPGQAAISFTKTSNSAKVEIFTLPRYGIKLTQPLTITVKPGDSVTWQNTVTNTGADAETVAMTFSVPKTLSNFEVYVDLNNNGIIDDNEQLLTPTFSLKAGEQIHLIVKALVDKDLKDGEQVDVPIKAVVQEDRSVFDTATDSLVAIVPAIHYKDKNYGDIVTTTPADQPVYLEVGLAACNASPTAVDYVWINVNSKLTGDTIRLKAVETGVNTGKYRITAPTELNANAIKDAVIQTLDGDVLEANATACENATGDITQITSDKLYTYINVTSSNLVLSVDKQANVRSAEVGDFVDYTVNVKNTGKANASAVMIKDELPLGFSYVKNSVRVDGKPYGTDFSRSGKYMTLGLDTLTPNQSQKVTYRVIIEPTALSGTGTNTVHATGTDTMSNSPTSSKPATAHVDVQAGRLNTDGIIIGKVYADFNRDGIQQKDRNELGVAGVRLYLEDGTFVVTDSEGKYSLYGISAKTHVIKLDRTTLPRGVALVEQSNRNAGDPGSRFVDLKYGELHRADFGITDGMNDGLDPDAQPLIAELQKRAKQVAAKNDALEQAIKTTLELEPTASYKDINRNNLAKIEAEGCKDRIEIDGQISCDAVIYDDQAHAQAPNTTLKATPVAPMQVFEIEKALSTADDQRIEGVTADADFLNLKDGQRVDSHKIRVQIKAPQGATTRLSVNNQIIDTDSIGKEVAWEKEGISGFDYIAVPLNKGNNTLSIQSSDSTGKVVSSKTISIHAPNTLQAITTQTSDHTLTADGVSKYQVLVSLKDKDNQLYTATTSVSLDSDIGTIELQDHDANQAGIQTFLEGGELLVNIKAPTVAGKGNLVIRAGTLQQVVPLQFTPKLRPMIAAGIVEGVIAFNDPGNGVQSANKNDGFEEELRSLSGSDANLSTHGRAAFFLKGKVRGDYLLTMAYDSDKDGSDRLFRDIRPDEYYPVYGDASAKGFDAQSTSKLYVRVDKGRSFAMYGDIKTHIENNDNTPNEGLSLGQYDRTLTGLKTHYNTPKTDVTAFIAETTSSQRVNETRGLGISGPYPLGVDFDSVLINSESVEVIVRDRNNAGVILSRQYLSRFSDYEIDSLSQALYLRSPIASQDLEGNPVYLRITVEADNAGESYLVGGMAGSRKLTDKIRVGGSYVQSDDPTNNEKLASINTVVKFNDRLKLVAETARYDSDKLGDSSNFNSQINAGKLNADKTGNASRVELIYKQQQNDAKLYYSQADIGFDPLSSPLIAGRTETGLKATSQLNAKTKLKAEAVQSKDATTNAHVQGVTASIERQLSKHLTGELGVRYYDKKANAASTNYQSVPATDIFNQSTPADITNNTSNYTGTTLRGKLTADLPKTNKSKVFVEYEQDIEDSSRHAWSVGGETSLWNKGRLYARHELASTLIGNYGLDANDRRQATTIGVDANYMQDGQVFSEYRVKDGMSSRDTEAAIGLRNKWKLKDGVYINTSFEHLESLSGKHDNEATAATIGLDYLANQDYKFTTRLEKRWGDQTDTLLNTLGYARKINDDITLLTKNNYSQQRDNKTDNARTLNRFQIGMTYRDFDNNIIDHLAKLEYRYDHNTLVDTPYNKLTYIASLHTNYHPVRRLTLSGHYAAKFNELKSDGIHSKSTTQLLAGRTMYDINERWDAGLQVGTMWSRNNNARYLFGAEVGYSPITNLWLSAGYNFKGYYDDDIAYAQDNQQGGYVRLRFKFDEDLLKQGQSSKNTRLAPNNEVSLP